MSKYILGGDFAVNNFFELSNNEGTQSALKLKDNFDINSLPEDGKVAFFLEVSYNHIGITQISCIGHHFTGCREI